MDNYQFIDMIYHYYRQIVFPELFESVRFTFRSYHCTVRAHEGTIVEERERLVDLLERDPGMTLSWPLIMIAIILRIYIYIYCLHIPSRD